jgi:hypothetical protein
MQKFSKVLSILCSVIILLPISSVAHVPSSNQVPLPINVVKEQVVADNKKPYNWNAIRTVLFSVGGGIVSYVLFHNKISSVTQEALLVGVVGIAVPIVFNGIWISMCAVKDIYCETSDMGKRFFGKKPAQSAITVLNSSSNNTIAGQEDTMDDNANTNDGIGLSSYSLPQRTRIAAECIKLVEAQRPQNLASVQIASRCSSYSLPQANKSH